MGWNNWLHKQSLKFLVNILNFQNDTPRIPFVFIGKSSVPINLSQKIIALGRHSFLARFTEIHDRCHKSIFYGKIESGILTVGKVTLPRTMSKLGMTNFSIRSGRLFAADTLLSKYAFIFNLIMSIIYTYTFKHVVWNIYNFISTCITTEFTVLYKKSCIRI